MTRTQRKYNYTAQLEKQGANNTLNMVVCLGSYSPMLK